MRPVLLSLSLLLLVATAFAAPVPPQPVAPPVPSVAQPGQNPATAPTADTSAWLEQLDSQQSLDVPAQDNQFGPTWQPVACNPACQACHDRCATSDDPICCNWRCEHIGPNPC